jgi:preprotein translocase subunit SecD
MSNLKYRLFAILGLVLVSAWTLFPRDVEMRQRRADGTFFDTTQRRVPLRYGLDLAGGMSISLEIDDSKRAVADREDAINRALKVVRTRIEGFGVSEPSISLVGNDRIVVELPGIDDRERAIAVVQDQAFLEFKIVDKSQALERVLPRIDGMLRDRGAATSPAGGARPISRAPTGLEGLLAGSDTADTTGTDTTAAADDFDAALGGTGAMSSLLQPGSMPGEYLVPRDRENQLTQYLAIPEVAAALPPGKQLLFSNEITSMGGRDFRALYMVDQRAIITGEFLTDARPTQDPIEGTLVQFTLNNVGGRRFRAETGRNIQNNMAIILDGRVMGRPPVIQSAIGTRGQITMGGRDLQAAQDLALVLRAGALPTPLRVAEVRTIGPSLGADSIRKGVTAAAISVVLVILVMIGYYRFSGVLAVAALSLYVVYTLAILAGFNAALTLPGLAGFVLSIGIAVDANVLIFERIREELDLGKTVRTAIDEGFRHAMPAIIDSNVTTILTAAVLYQYGTGAVKGFAVTLIAGIVASLISAIFVVKTFYLLWLSRSRGAQTLSI